MVTMIFFFFSVCFFHFMFYCVSHFSRDFCSSFPQASVVTGLELEDPTGMADTSMVIDIFALVVFTIECVLKILAEGERPGR